MSEINNIQFPPALLTRELAAYYISGSLRDVDELRGQGIITAVGTQKRVKFRRQDLDDWIASLPEKHNGLRWLLSQNQLNTPNQLRTFIASRR
jgi:hypothetical protein